MGGSLLDGLPGWLDKYRLKPIGLQGQQQLAWEPPRTVPKGSVKNLSNRIGALGNAVVPQIVAAIGECVWQWHVQRRRVRVAEQGGEIEEARV